MGVLSQLPGVELADVIASKLAPTGITLNLWERAWSGRRSDDEQKRGACQCPLRIISFGTYLPISNLPIAARCTSSGPSARRRVRCIAYM